MNMMTTLENEQKASELAKIANDDWPMLNELSQHSFALKNKKSTVDIEQTSKNLQKNSNVEDKKISTQNQKDDVVMKKLPPRGKKVVETNSVEDPVETTPNYTQVTQHNLPPETFVPVENVTKEEVKPQGFHKIGTMAYPKMNTANVNQKMQDSAVLLKQIRVGLTHLFIAKATTLLKPVNFVMQHFTKFFVAMIHILVPLLMTMWLTTKVEFIAAQLATETTTMYFAYCAVFYLGCTFLWIFGQVCFAGLVAMFKRSMQDVAKVGQDKL